MRSVTMLLLALALASPLAAQATMDDGDDATADDAVAAATTAAADDAAVAGVRWLYDTVKGYVVASAEQAPEALYGYRPTIEVRTFGQILGHVANANYMFCAAALGEESPSQRNLEELATKTELVEALKASFEYCDRAYAMDDATALETAAVFGQERTRLFALEFNMGHDFEHYGNLVTYMRSNGMVPPSSQMQGN